jgi:MFS family permease
MDSNAPGRQPSTSLTPIQWLICIIASIGFAFDTYVLLILPLIIRPAVTTLAKTTIGSPEYVQWARMLFFAPALAGGILGLLGGYLTDLMGRRRILTFSILLYAFSALASAFVTSMSWLVILRCLTFMGVCVEFVAAVAWLAELFPNPEQRERVLGYTQAFASIGGLLASGAYFLSVKYENSFPAIFGAHEPWRYALLSGVIPAIPLIIIRPFLPESPVWAKKRQEGTLKRPGFSQIFGPKFARTTIVTTIIFACGYGAAFGAIQQIPQIVPGLAEVRNLPKPAQQKIVSAVQFCQEMGGLAGRFVLAWLVVRIASRQKLLRCFLAPGLIILPVVFFYAATHSLQWLKIGVFFAGLVTVAQFSFWGNYLPGVYPVHLRGTGESFGANIGGRILGTSFAWITITVAGSPWLKSMLPQAPPATKFAYTAGAVGLAVYAIGLASSFFLPEPTQEPAAE